MCVVNSILSLYGFCFIALAAASSLFRNTLISSSLGGNAQCKSGFLDIQIVSRNLKIGYDGPSDNVQGTQLVLELTMKNSSRAADMVGGVRIINGTFAIYIQFCIPSNSSVHALPRSVQLLTHGGTMDHNYWDIASGYSYIDAMASSGYATLAYDRLGVGRSAHPDPIQEVQAAAHVEVIHAIVRNLREGTFENITFEEVIGVGHSVGSYFTLGMTDKFPENLDALVLTGVSTYPDFIPTSFASCAFQIANTVEGKGFETLPNGYLTPAPLLSISQYNFFHYPNFEDRGESSTCSFCINSDIICIDSQGKSCSQITRPVKPSASARY